MSNATKQHHDPPRDHEHDFALVLTGVANLTDDVMDGLLSAGFDDATISMRDGEVWAEFSRVAPSFDQAVASAINAARHAGIGAQFRQ